MCQLHQTEAGCYFILNTSCVSLRVYLSSWPSGNRVGLCLFVQACNNILKVQFPLKCANGSVELIEAYRAQHSHHRLPGTISTPVLSLVS